MMAGGMGEVMARWGCCARGAWVDGVCDGWLGFVWVATVCLGRV